MTTDTTEPLIPTGKRITNLTVAELDYASKKLGINVLTALMPDEKTREPHPRQAMALAVVALVWARRKDPGARLETFTGMELGELTAALGIGRKDPEGEELNLDPEDPSPSPSD